MAGGEQVIRTIVSWARAALLARASSGVASRYLSLFAIFILVSVDVVNLLGVSVGWLLGGFDFVY